MQNEQAAANEAWIRTIFNIRSSSFPSWWATSDSSAPEPIAALGYQANIFAGSSSRPVTLFEIQMPILK
jgi:hypothetical protein